MIKKIVIGLAGVAILAAALYAAGFRLALDGTGMWPRFLRRDHYAELEADRARQRDILTPDVLTQQSVPAETGSSAPAIAAPATQPPTPPSAGPTQAATEPTARPTPDAVAGSRGSWSDFRGPNRDGRYTEGPILAKWPNGGLRRLWRQPVGGGYASFVVADGRAYTIEQRRNQEVAAAYDVATGRELWTNGWNANFQESMGGDGPRATPTYHEGKIYALGAEGELRVLDAVSGKPIWRKNILSDNRASNLSWGMSASPLIVDDKVIVLPGGGGGQSVVAYNKLTGAVVWKSQNDPQGYTSPMLVTLGGVRQILVVSGVRAFGLRPEDGRLLWDYPWDTFNQINVAQPLIWQQGGIDRIFLSASYGRGAAVFELTRNGDRFQTKTIWENQRMKNKFTSSVLREGFIYGLDESILACLDANTGEQKWKGGRYGYGQILLAGDYIVVLTEDGDVTLVQATPERHVELASFPAIEGKTWNHPVIVAGTLLVRNIQEMAAFDIAVH